MFVVVLYYHILLANSWLPSKATIPSLQVYWSFPEVEVLIFQAYRLSQIWAWELWIQDKERWIFSLKRFCYKPISVIFSYIYEHLLVWIVCKTHICQICFYSLCTIPVFLHYIATKNKSNIVRQQFALEDLFHYMFFRTVFILIMNSYMTYLSTLMFFLLVSSCDFFTLFRFLS